MKTRQQKIEELKKQIISLEQEDIVEIQSSILPLIKEHCIFHWSEFGPIDVSFDSNEMKIRVLRLMEGKFGGFYHFGYNIDTDVSIRFDDGAVTLRFDYSGRNDDILNKSLNKIKELGLRLSFEKAIVKCQSEKKRIEDKIDCLVKYKEMYEN